MCLVAIATSNKQLIDCDILYGVFLDYHYIYLFIYILEVVIV